MASRDPVTRVLRGAASRAALVAVLAVGVGACRDREAAADAAIPLPADHRVTLGASFVRRDSAPLARLLHPQLIVQPPEPDSALQGDAAARYLVNLARHTVATESRLAPTHLAREGPFVLERGIWTLRHGSRAFRAHYMLRWRREGEDWRVVLWRWTRFR